MSLGLDFETNEGFTVTCWSADIFVNVLRKSNTVLVHVSGYKDETAMLAGKKPSANRQYAINEDNCDFSEGFPVLGTSTGLYAYLKTLTEWEGSEDIGE